MNNTIVIVLASLGGLLWLYAVLRERFKNSTGETLLAFLKRILSVEAATETPEPTGGMISIESLEQELGIEPDHYLCDRIARINEALTARRDKTTSKKKGGAS